jgi:hypothetical protein
MYVKPRLEEDSHLDLLRKSKAVLNNRQMFALKVSHPVVMIQIRTVLLYLVGRVMGNGMYYGIF